MDVFNFYYVALYLYLIIGVPASLVSINLTDYYMAFIPTITFRYTWCMQWVRLFLILSSLESLDQFFVDSRLNSVAILLVVWIYSQGIYKTKRILPCLMTERRKILCKIYPTRRRWRNLHTTYKHYIQEIVRWNITALIVQSLQCWMLQCWMQHR